MTSDGVRTVTSAPDRSSGSPAVDASGITEVCTSSLLSGMPLWSVTTRDDSGTPDAISANGPYTVSKSNLRRGIWFTGHP